MTVRGSGRLWDARVVESPAKAGVWKVQYTDSGVVAGVNKENLAVYALGEQELGSREWFALRNLVASGNVVDSNP